jgi:DNA-binding MarR family transcriptional regulator
MTTSNKTVELVLEWAKFEHKYPTGTLDEFCRYYLISQREKRSSGQNFKGVVPPHEGAYLSKLIGRIFQILEIYITVALKEVPEVKGLHDFYFLNSIQHFGESSKTSIIDYNFAELSTGIDIINRLLKLKLIQERVDDKDRRSRLVRTTPKGEKVLFRCYEHLIKASDIVFWEMSSEDRKLCIQLLKGVEIKHSSIAQYQKAKSIHEIHENITGVRTRVKKS